MTMPNQLRIAYYITPHGFGHASRSCAIMNALYQIIPEVHFDIFTQVPLWFFQSSLTASFSYQAVLTDIGLAQKTALAEDIPETIHRLSNFLPFEGKKFQDLVGQAKDRQYQIILCDIAPLGIAVAQATGIPSVLVENFTWDWIYESYVTQYPPMGAFGQRLAAYFQAADYHIQTEPLCDPKSADLLTTPISRAVRTESSLIRQQLGVSTTAKMIIITMGGIQWQYADLSALEDTPNIFFVVPGSSEKGERRGNLILLPHHSDFFHPDLITAADAVIGKIGYSTVAEIYQAGIPFGYIGRPGFRESKPLTQFIKTRMQGVPFTQQQFESDTWLDYLPSLLALPHLERSEKSGANQAAEFLAMLLE
ncbi:MAG: hypothetical protein AAF629_06940 [Chloroflexota bacterium]